MPSDLDSLLRRAVARRGGLLERADTTACRLVHGAPDDVPGLVVEKFGDVLTVQLHQDRLQYPAELVRASLDLLRGELGARAAYRKYFIRERSKPTEEMEREHHSPEPWLGRPVEEEFAVLANGLRFLIRPYDGFSVGLFLEHRENRARVQRLAAGQRVLNTFAYTCGFSVAAAAGGADVVDSVDLHKRYLEWGKRNFAANGIDDARFRFFCSDVFDFYARAARQGRRYDLIILDPPTFSRSRRPQRVFVLDEQLEELVSGAVSLLDAGGHVLLATNHQQIPAARLERALAAAAAAGRSCTIVERPPLPPDFPGDPGYSKTVIARFS